MAVIYNAKKPQQKGSGFLNIQKVLGANDPTRLGQAVGSGIINTANQAKQSIGTAQQNFNQQVDQKRLDTDANRASVGNILQNATTAAADPGQLNQFTKLREGAYEGPKDLGNVQSLQSQAQEAEGLGRATGSQAGQVGLLQRFAAKPGERYTTGAQRMDTLYLGKAAPQLKDARQQTVNLGQEVTRAQGGAQEMGKEIVSRAQEFGKETTQRLGTTQEESNKPINERVAEAQAREDKRKQALGQIQNLLDLQGVGNDNDAVQQAMQIAADNGMIDATGINVIGGLSQKLRTPVDKLVTRQNTVGPSGTLGYGLGTQNAYDYSHVPTTSQLSIRQLLRDAILNEDASNIGRGSLSDQTERDRINALSKLGGQTTEFNDSQYGQYRSGLSGFDLENVNRKIDEDLARLRQEQILPGTQQEVPMLERLRRGLAPTAAEQEKDILSKFQKPTTYDIASTVGTLGVLPLYTEAARAGAGIVSDTYSGVKKDAEDGNVGTAIVNAPLAGTQAVVDRAGMLSNVGDGLVSGVVGKEAAGLINPGGGSVYQGLSDTLGGTRQTINAIGSGDISGALSGLKNTLITPIVNIGKDFLAKIDPVTGRILSVVKKAPEILLGPAGAIGGAIVRGLKKLFCYAEGTEIRMQDGTYKKIEDIKVGDKCYLGGKVLETNEAVPEVFYFYRDTIVTGDKAVLIDGQFIKVKDVVPDEAYENTVGIRVIGIVNEHHVLVTKTHIGTDVSYSELVIDQLNENTNFLGLLKKQSQIMFGDK